MVLAVGVACRTRERTAPSAESSVEATQPKLAPKPAVLVGSVRLEAGQELPSYSPAQMERAVLAHVKAGSQFPKGCSPATADDLKPVRVTPDGKLIGVMLAASEFTARNDYVAPLTHNLTIKDCRLAPHMVTARIGDVLHIANESEFPMMPGIGAEQFNQTLTQNQSRDIKLDTGGVKILMCGFSAPCSRTDVVVMAHPYAAVTDDKGEFRIENFPPAETVHINAWHPLFAEAQLSVRVEPGEEKRVELVLTPKPPPPPQVPFTRDPNQVYPD